MRYPAAFQVRSWRAYVSPLSVDSNAKSALAVARRLISSMTRRPAASAANRGSSGDNPRSEEHTSELQSPCNLVCRLLLEKKKTPIAMIASSFVAQSPAHAHLKLRAVF